MNYNYTINKKTLAIVPISERSTKIYEKDYSEIPFLDNRHIRGGLDGKLLQAILHNSYLNLDEIMDHYAQSFLQRT